VLSDMSDNAPIENLTEEFADVFGCLIDSVHRSGITMKQINEAFRKKLENNKARIWKDNGDGSYSHVK
jgi:NTP pyrophosphatase (non-canonical NTP hydrolase)